MALIWSATPGCPSHLPCHCRHHAGGAGASEMARCSDRRYPDNYASVINRRRTVPVGVGTQDDKLNLTVPYPGDPALCTGRCKFI